MSLKQKLLKTIATGLTLAALSGMPAYASYRNLESDFENSSFAFGDIDRDGLTDMIVASDSAVTYFRNKRYSNFEYKQRIYTAKKKEKINIALLTIKGKSQLVIITPSEFKIYKLNGRGRFEEKEFGLEWMEDEPEEEESKPVKDVV